MSFVLLRFGEPPPGVEKLMAAAATRRVPFEVVDIRNATAKALYERRLVLVRPDGQVSWRDDAEPADALAVIDAVRGASVL